MGWRDYNVFRLRYWLNTPSNVRHNSSCRHFKNTKRGRSCSASEGKACKLPYHGPTGLSLRRHARVVSDKVNAS